MNDAEKKSRGGVHSGHRQRLRQKYIENGLDALSDHEVVELLLFYCIPMRDVNELAHGILDEFGSLAALFESGPADISRRTGLSEGAGVLFSLISAAYRRYELARSGKRRKLTNAHAAGEYCVSLFIGEVSECFYMLCLNSQRQHIKSVLLSRGTLAETAVYPRQVVQESIKNQAAYVIVSHNHPSGGLSPSKTDLDTTRIIVDALATIGVRVCDHIIVAGRNYVSFSEKRLLGLEY
ncbi:MAG: DNA repair protein RadC [Clostridiales bacterium]|jgi:DNA repair protein RadC|nr:DNA repair protein RadC [Clostridiales bacterium]